METRLMDKELKIRKAIMNDAPAMTALHAECFGIAKWSMGQIADSLVLKTTLSPIAYEGKTIRGFLFCQVVRDEAEILTFCVDPATRRQGTGMLLLSGTIEAARRKKVKRMFIEVSVDNVAAVAMYEKAGFHKIGRRSGYYKQGGSNVDAVTMAFDF
ncbi:MAG: ribosomal protein S18-alanine N-acetyltransferase [Bdellovibrionales bacterium]|jgi:ribosomal-protein-alanine N-acetyltransferase